MNHFSCKTQLQLSKKKINRAAGVQGFNSGGWGLLLTFVNATGRATGKPFRLHQAINSGYKAPAALIQAFRNKRQNPAFFRLPEIEYSLSVVSYSVEMICARGSATDLVLNAIA